jgi:hypothetical protein
LNKNCFRKTFINKLYCTLPFEFGDFRKDILY